MKNEYRVKTVTVNGKEPYHCAQVKMKTVWMTIYPAVGKNNEYLLLDDDTVSDSCRFDSYAHAEAHCKMYDKTMNPEIIISYREVNV